ncbi:MAG: glycosyltransferase family 39 protein [Acidobacteria bacterium]|nr:glycosyltransferase family 39 protein [Acidobacteriota bacterium]
MSRPRSSIRVSQKTVKTAGYRPVLTVLGIVLILRIIHLACAIHSPLSFQLSPDEDYYLRFALSVAQGNGARTAQFAFMDPAAGYIAGAVFRIFNGNLFVLYVLQTLLDTFTAFCLILIGRELQHPRAGLLAGLVYGCTATSLLFCTTLLKTIWVANFMAVWVLCGLMILRKPKMVGWLLFGFLCGYGIALRSTLLLMAGISLVLLPWLSIVQARRTAREVARAAIMLILGLLLPVALLSLHNMRAIGSFSPLPTNGGIVLHQRYNPDNRTADNWIPPFVSYWHPLDIYRGYTEEARKRLGRELTPREVDAYWRGQAMDYILSHPFHVASNILRKFALFVAYPEIPNDRSLADERLFSPILSILPSPFGWLFALGVPGFVLLLRRDRRGWLVTAPIATVLVTVCLFDSIDRFRFQAVPMFALGTGFFLEYLAESMNQKKIRQTVIMLITAAALGAASMLLADTSRVPPTRWDKAVWGYLRMDNLKAAKALALKVFDEQPNNYRILNALGQIAASEGDYTRAANYYRRAVELRPKSHIDHYRLALMLAKIGLQNEAVEHAATALSLARKPEYRALLQELRAGR